MFLVDTIVVLAVSRLQCLNRWLPGLFLIDVKQRLLDHSVKQYIDNQIFACPYWKSPGILCGLESGCPGLTHCEILDLKH